MQQKAQSQTQTQATALRLAGYGHLLNPVPKETTLLVNMQIYTYQMREADGSIWCPHFYFCGHMHPQTHQTLQQKIHKQNEFFKFSIEYVTKKEKNDFRNA